MIRHFGKLEQPQNFRPALGPDFISRISNALSHFWALPFGCRIATALEVLYMLAVRSEGRREAAGLQGVQHRVDFSIAEYRLLE